MEEKIKDIDFDLIRGVTIDIWGTLFDDSESSIKLNKVRENIFAFVTKKNKLKQCQNSWKDVLNNEISSFKKSEVKGQVITSKSRINRILKEVCNVEDDDISNTILKYYDFAAVTFLPKVNLDLVEKILVWRNQGIKIGIISNTGMITAEATRMILKKMQIYNLFQEILLSEEVGICKPSPEIFWEASRRMGLSCNEMLHIGDSVDFDLYPARSVGYKAVWVGV